MRPSSCLALGVAAMSAFAAGARAEGLPELKLDGGKLLLTGGVSNVEGAAGGGLASWAVIGGYGTRDGIGGNVHATYVGLPDFEFRTAGVAVGLFDRVELSYARQAFDTQGTGAKL